VVTLIGFSFEPMPPVLSCFRDCVSLRVHRTEEVAWWVAEWLTSVLHER
jgi:hypothetical protein